MLQIMPKAYSEISPALEKFLSKTSASTKAKTVTIKPEFVDASTIILKDTAKKEEVITNEIGQNLHFFG